MKGSLYKAGTSPPHYFDSLNVPVDRQKTTKEHC